MSSDMNSPLGNLKPENILPLARADLACYGLAMCPDYQLAAHHRVLIEKLEAVERGTIRRLAVFMPPRHGKSVTSSCIFPAWYLGRNPNRSVIGASYGSELAEDFGRRVRNFMSDPLHAAIFPECKLAAD
jgi:hypothetical protein